MKKLFGTISLSDQQWAIPTGDAIIIGRRDVIFRKISGGAEFSQFLSELQILLRARAMSPASLYGEFQGRFPEAFIDEAIGHLITFGVLERVDDAPASGRAGEEPPSSDEAVLDDYLGSDARSARLRSSRVAVIGTGRLADRVVGDLAELGIDQIARIGSESSAMADPADVVSKPRAGADDLDPEFMSGCDMVVAVADDPLERLRSFPVVNRAVLAGPRCPWLAAYVNDHRAFVGPLFVPGETGCYRCMELREENHFPHPTEFGVFKAALANPEFTCAGNTPAPMVAAASGIIAAEALKILARTGHPGTYQTLVIVDFNLLDMERHVLLKVPFCDICGTHLHHAFRKTWDV